MKKIALLGATGCVGTNCLDILASYKDKFQLISFSFYENIDNAREILQSFSPQMVACAKKEQAEILAIEFPQTKFVYGMDGLIQVSTLDKIDILVTALTGAVGLKPTLAAIEAGIDIALANKETLAMAGKWVMEKAKEKKVKILPIDTEHSAIFQCLKGQEAKTVKSLIITASGGSFRDKTRDELNNVTLEDALAHPNWIMGKKITIDSSTMVNKGLEVIEAHFLFDMPYEAIQVIQHRQSIVHSMVEFIDGSILAQLGANDIRQPILYALDYPERLQMMKPRPFDLTQISQLDFEKMDMERFPMLALAIKVGRDGGSFPCVYNAANEAAVAAFIAGEIRYLEIEALVTKAVSEHVEVPDLDLEKILAIDLATRMKVKEWTEGKF